MKMLLALVTLSLAFATGFTCSKQQAVEEAPPAQEEMMQETAPPAEMPPAEGMPAEGAPATETAPPADQ